MIDVSIVGKNIAALRRKAGFTQQGLAATLSVSHQAVSKWENGAALPDLQILLNMSRLFGVSIEEILSGQSEPIEIVEPAADEKPEEGGQTISMDEIRRMAPFVSPDVLDQMLSACSDPVGMADLMQIAQYMNKPSLAHRLEECGDVDWDALVRIAMTLGRDSLAAVIEKHIDTLTAEVLRRMAPFLSRDTVADLYRRLPGREDLSDLKRFAPFLGRDALAGILYAELEQVDIELLITLAPFLNRAVLGDLLEKCGQQPDYRQMLRLTRFLPREVIDRIVRKSFGFAAPENGFDCNDIGNELGNMFGSLGDSIRDAVNDAREAVNNIDFGGIGEAVNSTLRDVGEAIQQTVSEVVNGPIKEEAAEERTARIKNRIAAKALEEQNWDWIAAHIGEVSGDMLKEILMQCGAAGHSELILPNADRADLTSAELCRLCQTVADEEIWYALLPKMSAEHAERVRDFIATTRPESPCSGCVTLEKARALKQEDGEAFLAAAQHMCQVDLLILAEEAVTAHDAMAADLIRLLDAIGLQEIFPLTAESGEAAYIRAVAENADPEMLLTFVTALYEKDHADLVPALLEGTVNVDLSTLVDRAAADSAVADLVMKHGTDENRAELAMQVYESRGLKAVEPMLPYLTNQGLEALLDAAMDTSDWEAIDVIDAALNR